MAEIRFAPSGAATTPSSLRGHNTLEFTRNVSGDATELEKKAHACSNTTRIKRHDRARTRRVAGGGRAEHGQRSQGGEHHMGDGWQAAGVRRAKHVQRWLSSTLPWRVCKVEKMARVNSDRLIALSLSSRVGWVGEEEGGSMTLRWRVGG